MFGLFGAALIRAAASDRGWRFVKNPLKQSFLDKK